MRKIIFTACFFFAVNAYLVESSYSQVILAPASANRLTVTIAASVAFDPVSKLYTYNYKVTNAAASLQELSSMVFNLSGDAVQTIKNPVSPHGWEFSIQDNSTVDWTATLVDNLPANFVDDGSVPPSPYQVKPGQSLAGFSFQSSQPPTNIKVYAQGFVQPAQAVDAGDLDDEDDYPRGYTDDSAISVTQAPVARNVLSQPSRKGLFSVTQISNEAVRTSPVTVGVHFSDQNIITIGDFSITLNGTSVTQMFKPSGVGTDLVATFDIGSSPLISGKNSIKAFTSSDLDNIVFYVDSDRPLDLNGDGYIDCKDLAIIKASMGRKINEAGFDPRADINGDAVIDIRDFATLSKSLPAGTRCQ